MISAEPRPVSSTLLADWQERANALIDRATEDAHLLARCREAYENARDMGSDSDRAVMAHEDLRQARGACRRSEQACHALMSEVCACYPRGTTPGDLPPALQGVVAMITYAHGIIWGVGHL